VRLLQRVVLIPLLAADFLPRLRSIPRRIELDIDPVFVVPIDPKPGVLNNHTPVPRQPDLSLAYVSQDRLVCDLQVLAEILGSFARGQHFQITSAEEFYEVLLELRDPLGESPPETVPGLKQPLQAGGEVARLRVEAELQTDGAKIALQTGGGCPLDDGGKSEQPFHERSARDRIVADFRKSGKDRVVVCDSHRAAPRSQSFSPSSHAVSHSAKESASAVKASPLL
jgi:hypothetical protein